MASRASMKYAAFRLAEGLGCNALLRRARRRQLLILCYHGVIAAPADPLGYSVHAAEFERQMCEVSRRFRPIALGELIAALDDGMALPDRAALVTFDDGYRNNLTMAAPILRRHGIPAVIHVAAGYIGANRILWVEEIRLRLRRWPRPSAPMPGGRPDCVLPEGPAARDVFAERVAISCKDLNEAAKQQYLDRLRETAIEFGEERLEEAYAFLNWDEVRQLQAQGFAIGSHTVTHPILAALDAKDAAWEVAESKRIVEERLGTPCHAIAYPNGRYEDVSAAALEAARDAGYRAGFLVVNRFNRHLETPLELTRINVPGYVPPCAFDARVSGLVEFRN